MELPLFSVYHPQLYAHSLSHHASYIPISNFNLSNKAGRFSPDRQAKWRIIQRSRALFTSFCILRTSQIV